MRGPGIEIRFPGIETGEPGIEMRGPGIEMRGPGMEVQRSALSLSKVRTTRAGCGCIVPLTKSAGLGETMNWCPRMGFGGLTTTTSYSGKCATGRILHPVT